MDWASRRVPAWRLSNTLDTAFCLAALRRGAAAVRTAAGLQHRSGQAVHDPGVSPSGCGRPASGARWMAAADAWTTLFIERLWRSLKYEAVYLHELADGRAARRVIRQWMARSTTSSGRTRRSAGARRRSATTARGRPASRRRSDGPTKSPDRRRPLIQDSEADDRADAGLRDERV